MSWRIQKGSNWINELNSLHNPGWGPRLKTSTGQTDLGCGEEVPDRPYPKIGIGQTEQTLAPLV